MNNKEYSPFTPGNPVPVELFVGRIKQIEELLRYVGQVSSGKQENIFLIGDRGIGKSSLASFLRFLVEQKDFLGIHVFLGRVSTLEEMVQHIFDQILKEAKKQKWYNNIAKFFGKHIKEVDLFGISVSFAPPEQDLKKLVRNFPEAVFNLLEKIKEEKVGLFIAMDDINGLAEREEFANWYKSFVDETATHYEHFPVFMMPIGLPEKRSKMVKFQPSLARIFRVVEIERLSDEEVRNFLSKAFEKVKMRVEASAMEIMVRYSSGLPLLMHEIGDATFWIDIDGVINEKDALKGIIRAAENVGQKYLDPRVYRVIRSERYKSILRKLGDPPSQSFRKKDIEKRLNEEEKKVFHNFLRRMRELGVIESDIERARGAYKFVNAIYPVYIWMENEKSKRSRKIKWNLGIK
ncbi:MAG: hypothetical protein DRG83_19480 [Deltaproteobacteria bacterium]|nr:MAG: hypothetical protein DRG83_19480 [Deltaproteobacteria bacterium]